MTIWILDTDHVSLFLAGNKAVVAKAASLSPDIAITIITVQEIFNGWASRLNAPSRASNLVKLYAQLSTTLAYFKQVTVLQFDDDANRCYEDLLRQNQQLNRKRLQKDLRIAAIALSTNGVVVTRNQRDFAQVPGLVLENWAQDANSSS